MKLPHTEWWPNAHRDGRIDWAPYGCACSLDHDHDHGGTEWANHWTPEAPSARMDP